jgi:hypothetical protein
MVGSGAISGAGHLTNIRNEFQTSSEWIKWNVLEGYAKYEQKKDIQAKKERYLNDPWKPTRIDPPPRQTDPLTSELEALGFGSVAEGIDTSFYRTQLAGRGNAGGGGSIPQRPPVSARRSASAGGIRASTVRDDDENSVGASVLSAATGASAVDKRRENIYTGNSVVSNSKKDLSSSSALMPEIGTN